MEAVTRCLLEHHYYRNSRIDTSVRQAQRREMHTRTRDPRSVVFSGPRRRGAAEPACLDPVPSDLPSTAVLSLGAPGLGGRATCRPHLDRPCLSGEHSGRGGSAGLPGPGGGAFGTRARPHPSAGHAPDPAIGRRARGRGRAGAGGACGGRPRVSACLPGLRARRPGWLGCAWVPAPAPAPAMGNSHHKRKAPSGPRARSFWRFGRSGRRPAGRGWGGGGAGGRRVCLPQRRRRGCPLPGWARVSVGPGMPRRDPAPRCTHRHMQYRRAGTCACSQFTATHNTPVSGHTGPRSHTRLHPHHGCRTHGS